MKTPHVHAELIHMWADGAEIEYKSLTNDWETAPYPGWSARTVYRIKPTPKPDVVEYMYVNDAVRLRGFGSTRVKYTFDGETGKLKSAEVI